MLKALLRLGLLIGVLAMLALPSFAQTGDTFRVTVTSMNARSGPGIEYDIVARLSRNGSYSILDYSPTGNWVLLNLGYGQAWAFRHLGEVTYSSPAPVMEAMSINTVGTTSLGQGGGFAPSLDMTMPMVTETGVDLSVTSTVDQFNSTVGVLGSLRLRSAPSLNARVLMAIPPEARPTPLGRTRTATWIQVNYEGTVGWVYFMYVAFPPAIDVRTLPVTG